MHFFFHNAGRRTIAAVLLGATTTGALAQADAPTDIVQQRLDGTPDGQGGDITNKRRGSSFFENVGDNEAARTSSPPLNPVLDVQLAETPGNAGDGAAPGEVAGNFGWGMNRSDDTGVGDAASDSSSDDGRTLDPEGDPITQGKIRLLDETGLIARQEQISEGILMMEQQVRYANAIGQVLSVLGPEARVEIAPGEFVTFEDSPAAIKSRINMLRLRQELAVAENELFRMDESNEITPDEVESMDLQTRDDGSDSVQMTDEDASIEVLPEGGAGGAEAPADQDGLNGSGTSEARLAELERRTLAAEERAQRAEEIAMQAQEASETAAAAPEMSLREVYGFAGRFTAVVDIGEERREVMTGESLPGGRRVLEVGTDYIRVLRNGEESRYDM